MDKKVKRGPTDRRTDKAGCRVACTRLKRSIGVGCTGGAITFIPSTPIIMVPSVNKGTNDFKVDQIYMNQKEIKRMNQANNHQ